MTLLNAVSPTDLTQDAISGELVDALIEAVVLPADPCARSSVIDSLVQEMCSTVAWRYTADEVLDRATQEELTSIRRLSGAAHEHHRRMAAFGSAPVSGGAR